MKTLVAIDPIEPKGKSFNNFCEALKLFQSKGIISETTIASTIHASLYLVPFNWYEEMKGRFATEARDRIHSACVDRFEFNSIKLLQSDSSSNEDLVAQMSRVSHKLGNDLLVIGSSNRAGLPHWILGSFAETAALTAATPVLVVKPHWMEAPLSRKVRFLVAVDITTPPTTSQINWIVRLAKSSSADVDLVFVEPRHRVVLDLLQVPKIKTNSTKVLEGIQSRLVEKGVFAAIHVIPETKSIAHALATFGDQKKSWVFVMTSAKRSLPHRLLLGSTARRLLALAERPLLSLRLDK